MNKWKEIPGLEGKYSASADGEILSHVNDIILKPYSYHDRGFLSVSIAGRLSNERVDRMVLMAFIGDADGLHPCHIDGDVRNNRLDNMKWGTAEEARICLARGRKGTGNKLSPKDVHEIRRLHKTGLNYSEIARETGISHATISSIIRGLTWAHLPETLT